MAQGDDNKQAIGQIIRQEQALIFPSLDENDAFSLGQRIRDIAVKDKLGIAIDISLWGRRLFFAATAGATADNTEWLRRKFNVVRRFHVSTYRLVLEQNREDRMFAPYKALDVADYALAGGGFPIRVSGGGRHWGCDRFRPAAARGSQSRRARCCRTCGAGPGCAGAACGLKI
ncbi:UPF0303 protein [Brucella sp. NVSL 07-0026]|nr:UPF0303 protein [Brucella sp. NVSL 07-0026]